MGIISSELSAEEALQRLKDSPNYAAIDFVKRVTTPEPYVWEPTAPREDGRVLEVSLIDCGVKNNIMRELAQYGVRTTVFPCTTSAAEILERDPDGIAFSPGPGDPKHLEDVVRTARELIHTGKPVFGICLGNQIVGKAFGAGTFKLPFGHRGGNHPVKELETDRVYITSQNHGYAVDAAGLERSGLVVSHVNLNDGTVEGLRHRELPVFTIQYHPEANPGPRDSNYMFNRFVEAMEKS
jgi:carbamoyl-phosphate synthase small subunit